MQLQSSDLPQQLSLNERSAAPAEQSLIAGAKRARRRRLIQSEHGGTRRALV
jgi:hypothetical protein